MRNRFAQLLSAWRIKAVRIGFLGTLLIAIGALSPAYLPRTTPAWQLLDAINATGTVAKIVGTIITMLGATALLYAWLRLRPSLQTEPLEGRLPVRYWAILLIWSIPFLVAPPIFSHDAYAYAAQGWLVHNDISPYDVGPGVLPGAFADQVAWVWRMTKAPYGPLSLQIQHLLVDLCGHHAYLAACAMRVPALLGVGMIAYWIPRIARAMQVNVAFASWFAVLNPLLLINFVGGCHNDSLMVGFMVFGIWLAYWKGPSGGPSWLRGNWWWIAGAVAIGFGAAIKQPAIMAAYALPLIARPWADWSRREVGITVGRVLLSFAVSVATFCAITFATGLGFGWITAVDVPGKTITAAPFTLIGLGVQWVIDLFGLDPSGVAALTFSRSFGLGVAAILVALLAITVARRKPVTFLALGYLVVAICSPALRSWYLQWGGTLLPLADLRPNLMRGSVWVTVVLLSYDAIDMAWRNDAIAIGIAMALGALWLVYSHQPLRMRISAASADQVALATDPPAPTPAPPTDPAAEPEQTTDSDEPGAR